MEFPMKKRLLVAVLAALAISSLQTPTQARPCADVSMADVDNALSIAQIGYGHDFEGFDAADMYLPYMGGTVRTNMDGDDFIAGGC
jgi:opacity protein-like surface antigen